MSYVKEGEAEGMSPDVLPEEEAHPDMSGGNAHWESIMRQVSEARV